ncbi:MAG: carboxypeptidase-like regulatory domain-containing protein [Saprospiraceae bacterium]|uniref:Carboxypeptidase-like regulatory domain-containing protein n=1 Tax=Candidatus Opimibacter skivensis TaxID=2982028 RepID=A0A9D7SR47_9BACT|nr:carboxypeptidase-like regulatory domain-containing protein [Candidatus Opimibacter skivensis]
MSADKSMGAGATEFSFNSKKDEGYYANQMNPDLMKMRVAGKVVDEITGEPILFAPINIANTNLFELTDIDGNFNFYIPEPTAEIVVEYTGYFSTSSIVQQGQIDKVIVLHEGSTIPDPRSEIELNKISLESKHAHFLKVDTEDFRQYLNNNSIYPLATTYDPVGKMVKLEFIINKKQMLDHIKVLKSSGGKQYEEEAIRLLKSGPSWRCEDALNFPCTREFTIYFK